MGKSRDSIRSSLLSRQLNTNTDFKSTNSVTSDWNTTSNKNIIIIIGYMEAYVFNVNRI